ncbi:hypothetical protein KVR01_009535 [Diaporthe batatas]|uniref:uncharacterized protein n=1 Tax=Diaporthe batatas TaxID=748121 RepID=UPI001D0377B8|nr:uncharacterized protein KVR01_009535 [Diaporthe batatas]KAG8161271.1 hypothetical protein KVR01_009535 [Diaporthe batatas]
MESAKQKFVEAVAKTREPGDAKGPPGGEMRVAQPSKNDASISNTFTTMDRTANPQKDEDKHAATGGNPHFGTSFFKPGSAT